VSTSLVISVFANGKSAGFNSRQLHASFIHSAISCNEESCFLFGRPLPCPVCLWRWCIVAKRLDGSRWNLARRQASATLF